MSGTTIRLKGCRKAFADGTVAVQDLHLTIEPGDQAQRGSFTAARRAENRQRFAGLNGQVQVLYSNGAVGKCLAAALQAYGRAAHRLSPRARRALMACNAISSGTISKRKSRV